MKTPFHLIIFKTFGAHKSQVRPYMTSIGLSPGQPKILSVLTLKGSCLQKDLARYCDIEPATVSKLLNPMEESGLLTRSSVEGNKRATLITITEKGKERKKQMDFYMQELKARSLKGFSQEEQNQFMEYLCRMYSNLTNHYIE